MNKSVTVLTGNELRHTFFRILLARFSHIYILKSYSEFEENINQSLTLVIQPLGTGRDCKRKDLTVESIVTVYRQFDTGMMDEFSENTDKRLLLFPIIFRVKKAYLSFIE